MSIESDLAYVKQVLASTRKTALFDTVPLIDWGLLTVVGCIASTWIPKLDNVWLWVVLMGVGWMYAGWRSWRVFRGRGVVTLLETGLYGTWFSAYLAMSLVGFGGYALGIVPANAIAFHDAILFGVAFAVSAGLLRSRSLGWISLGWWLAAMAIALTPDAWRMLLFGAAISLFLIVPCVIYRRRHSI